MWKFPIILGTIGKKLYLTIIMSIILIVHYFAINYIPQGHNVSLINNLGANVIEMLSVLIPCIFKFKGKSKTSKIKCSKAIFIDYFILLLLILSLFTLNYFIPLLKIQGLPVTYLWSESCLRIIFYIILSILVLKTKYYIHNVISLILFCIFSVIIDLIFGYFGRLRIGSFLYLLPDLIDALVSCYIKYLIDKKYHSYWNILFFHGLYFFIINGTRFLIIIIKDPYNNSIFKIINKAEIKYFILNFLLNGILKNYLRMLLNLLILEYLSLNHVLISIILVKNIAVFSQCVSYNKFKKYLYFLIPAFFQILSLLFFLEILEFNFCNLNRNTKRNIMLRQQEEILLQNNTNESDIDINSDLIVKLPQEDKELELNTIVNDIEKKEDDKEI